MGNICCQTDVERSPFEENIIKMDQYQVSTLPSDDNIINEWLLLNNITLPTSTQSSSTKVMKHKQNSHYYYGQWKDGVPQGKGVFYEPKKILFNGNFVNGLPEGLAHIKFIDSNSEFNGLLKEGKAEGNGELDNAKGKYKFTGEWKNSKPQKGTLTLVTDKNISNIQFEDFRKKRAIINYKDNRRYEGEISTDKLQPHGRGKVQFPFQSNKRFYDGEWFNGHMQGKGTFKWNDDSQYEGQFSKGKKQGYGKFTFSNGNYYEGYWIEGKQEGAGTLYNKQNEVLKRGRWKNGMFATALDKEEWQKEEKESGQKRERTLKQVKREIKAEQEYKNQNNLKQKQVKLEQERSSKVSGNQQSRIKREENHLGQQQKNIQPVIQHAVNIPHNPSF